MNTEAPRVLASIWATDSTMVTGERRERLLSWVCKACFEDARMAASLGRTRTLKQHAMTMAGDLGIDSDSAEDLCRAAGVTA